MSHIVQNANLQLFSPGCGAVSEKFEEGDFREEDGGVENFGASSVESCVALLDVESLFAMVKTAVGEHVFDELETAADECSDTPAMGGPSSCDSDWDFSWIDRSDVISGKDVWMGCPKPLA